MSHGCELKPNKNYFSIKILFLDQINTTSVPKKLLFTNNIPITGAP